MAVDPYDVMPYPDVVVRTTSPSHVGAVALLLGAEPAAPKRIVELGCGTGANTIAVARDWPGAEVVGVDRSGRQIEMAWEAARGVGNVTFRQADILAEELGDLGAGGGVDYVICHGVYSWVPPAVQERILELCGRLLSERGVGVISFNVLPGWHVKLPIREMLLFHTAGFETAAEKVEQARKYLELLREGIAEPESTISTQLRLLAGMVLESPDAYILHEYLCEFNEPILFETFAGRIGKAGLQYVGDADFGSNVPAAISEATKGTLMEIAGSRERYEQHLDFLMNRTFRRALVMRAEAEVTGRFSSRALRRMRFRAKKVEVEGGGDALMTALREVWPGWGSVEEIVRRSGGDLPGVAGKMLMGIAEGWVEVRLVE